VKKKKKKKHCVVMSSSVDFQFFSSSPLDLFPAVEIYSITVLKTNFNTKYNVWSAFSLEVLILVIFAVCCMEMECVR
jgi:hypothetical protein